MNDQQRNAFIVDRSSIPAIHSVEQGGKQHSVGELRDFRWQELLKRFMPPASELSISWVALAPQEVLEPHVHPIQSMMIFYRGSGQLLGQKAQSLREGDVVVVPAGCEHGFVGGPDGLYALSVQFGEGLYTEPTTPLVVFAADEYDLDQLVAHNEARLQEFHGKRIFSIMRDGTLEDPIKRRTFLDALQIWVDGNQTLLFTRQATCRDPFYEPIFFKHLQEEVGHEVLHANREDDGRSALEDPSPPAMRDPALEAITSWFPYQMLMLDNIEKVAIIHLVIEHASIAYHQLAKPHLARYVNTEYFDVHIEADSEHAALGVDLLQNQSAKTYLRLKEIVDEAWDMLGAMVDRVTDLTLAA